MEHASSASTKCDVARRTTSKASKAKGRLLKRAP